MARGSPDWYGKRKTMINTPTLDMGELAARLGSPYVYDRRGDVMFLEGFENGIGDWATGGGGTGTAVVATTARALRGGVSAKLTAGSDGSLSALMDRRLTTSFGQRVGLTETWSGGGNFAAHFMQMSHYDGSTLRQYALRYDFTNQELQYLDENNAWVAFATGVTIAVANVSWVDWKLIIDLDNYEYVAALVGPTAYSLADIAPRSAAAATAPQIMVRLHLLGTAGGNGLLHSDAVIVTINEP